MARKLACAARPSSRRGGGVAGRSGRAGDRVGGRALPEARGDPQRADRHRRPAGAGAATRPGLGRSVFGAPARRVPDAAGRGLRRAGCARGAARRSWRTGRGGGLGGQRAAARGVAGRAPAAARGGHRLRRARPRGALHHPGPQRQRLFRRDLRSVVRRGRIAHLDRRRWRVVRRPARGPRGGTAGRAELRRGLRTGVLRRQGRASADHVAGHGTRTAHHHPQHLPSGTSGYPHHRRARCGGSGERPDAQCRPGPAQPGRHRPDRRARHGGARVRRAAQCACLGGDDFAGFVGAFDLLRGQGQRGRQGTGGAAGCLRARAGHPPDPARAAPRRRQRAGRRRRRHGRHAGRVGAPVRRAGARAGEHPGDRAGLVRAQHLRGHRQRRRHQGAARGACRLLAVAADLRHRRDRAGQRRRGADRATAGRAAATAGQGQPGPAPARHRLQHAHGAGRAQPGRRLACAFRRQHAGRGPGPLHRAPAVGAHAARGDRGLQRQSAGGRPLRGMAGRRHPRGHAQQAGRGRSAGALPRHPRCRVRQRRALPL